MLVSGTIPLKGVLAPETALDPEAFIQELNKREIGIHAIEE